MSLSDLRQAILERSPSLEGCLPYVRFAVNERFEYDLSRILEDGDTVALIPPVSGGLEPALLTGETLDPRVVEASVYSDECGAVVTFAGRVRNHTGEHQVVHLEYEAYGSMAERVFLELLQECRTAYPGVRIAVQHRIGLLSIGETAVVIAAASPHRADAFAACQTFIERLKEDVPIFKKEARGDGSVWVGMGS